jgi:two-component system response regulator RegA
MSETGVRSLLLVDDDESFRSRLARAMRTRGFAVREAASAQAALAEAKTTPVSHAVVDLRLGDKSGLEVVRDLKSVCPAARVIVLTGYGSIATALEATRLGASDYLAKPVDADDVTRALDGDDRRAPPPSAPSLARVEWEHINRVLMDCDGNVTAAARALGIHRRSLQRKLAKFPTSR